MQVFQYGDDRAVGDKAGGERLQCLERGPLDLLRAQPRQGRHSLSRPEAHDLGEQADLCLVGVPAEDRPHGALEGGAGDFLTLL